MSIERGIFVSGFSIKRASRDSSDGQGGFTTTYPVVSTPRGRMTPLTLDEQERAGQMVGVVTHRFSTSASVDIQKGDKIAYDGRDFVVHSVSKTSTGLRKQCLCEEVNTVAG